MKHKNGIVFYSTGNFMVSRQGKVYEVVTRKGSDGGPELVKAFNTAQEAVDCANKLRKF